MKKDTKLDGTYYYSYILVYVDDTLTLLKDPKAYMQILSEKYYVKKSSIGAPDLYLGTQYKLVIGRSENPAWSSSTDRYVKEATSVSFECMNSMGLKLTKRHKSSEHPFSNSIYRPELDMSEPCNSDEHHFYQQMVGIAQWMIEICRIDIAFEVSLMLRHLAGPCIGHLY